MDDLPPPVEKLSISGPTLASLIQSFSSSHGDVDGLLFGHITRLPPPDLHDDDHPSSSTTTPFASSSSTPIVATITGHLCFCSPMSFYDSVGHIDTRILTRALAIERLAPNTSVLGWFSGRRCSPLRPSMREFAVSVSLAKVLKSLTVEGKHPRDPAFRSFPCLFVLLSTMSTPNLSVHTHEYRAFEMRKTPGGGDLVPKSLSVVNVGPAFRGQYGSFGAESGFPLMPCGVEVKGEGDEKSLIGMKKQGTLDTMAGGFGLDKLRRIIGPGATQYKSDVEDLYAHMLHRLEALAALVQKSSTKVYEQEIQNLKLRSKIAGLE